MWSRRPARCAGSRSKSKWQADRSTAVNLLPNSADEGRLRLHPLGIGSSTYVPIAIPQKIEEYFNVILRKAQAIPDPLEQSFFVMVHIPYLQPIADANKRTSRLAANISQIKQNLVPLSFSDVAPAAYRDATLAVYEFNDISLLRDVFTWAYSRSSQQFKVSPHSDSSSRGVERRKDADVSRVRMLVAISPPRPGV